eukprot:8583970-Alexandrium_andersonii.AAC.1
MLSEWRSVHNGTRQAHTGALAPLRAVSSGLAQFPALPLPGVVAASHTPHQAPPVRAEGAC